MTLGEGGGFTELLKPDLGSWKVDKTSVARLPPVPTASTKAGVNWGLSLYRRLDIVVSFATQLCGRGQLRREKKNNGEKRLKMWYSQWRGWWTLCTGSASPDDICHTGVSWFAARIWWPAAERALVSRVLASFCPSVFPRRLTGYGTNITQNDS